MKLQFDTHGNEKQKEAARSWANPDIIEIVYGGGKGGGKTYLGCKLIFGDALMYPGTRYFIARKELNDLRKYTLSSVQECFKDWGLDFAKYYTFNGQDNYFTLHNGSMVYFLAAKFLPSDPDYYRFGSMQMTRGWIEEAGEVELSAKNNLQASVGRWMNKEYNLAPKLLQTCNPSKNYLYKTYKASKANALPGHVAFIQALLDDNKMLDESYKHNLLLSLTKEQTQRLVYGNWEYDDDPATLMSYDAICDLFTNEAREGDKCVVADLAMKGRDRFVAGIGDGHVMTIRVDKTYSPAKEIEEDLRILQAEAGVGRSQMIADSDGLGQYLESYIEGIKEFHGNARATDDKYANLRSQCYYKLAEMVNNRLIKVVCSDDQQEKIKDELGVVRSMFVDDPEKKLRIIPKDDMKGLLGHSPDYADTLMMWMVRFVLNNVNVFNAEYVPALPGGVRLYGLRIGDHANPYALSVTAVNQGLVSDVLIYKPYPSIVDFAKDVKSLGLEGAKVFCHPTGSQFTADLNGMSLGVSFLPCKPFADDDTWRCDLMRRNGIRFVNREDIRKEVDTLYFEQADGRVSNRPNDIDLYPFIQAVGSSLQYEVSLR